MKKNANTDAIYAKRYNLILMTQYWFSPFIGMIQSFPCWNTNTANTIKGKDTAPGFFDWKDPKFRGHSLSLCWRRKVQMRTDGSVATLRTLTKFFQIEIHQILNTNTSAPNTKYQLNLSCIIFCTIVVLILLLSLS